MNTARARSAYQKSEAQAQIHPVKLIHLLYERVLVHLELAEQGVVDNDARARGENMSKAIAIISELNASIKDGDSSEAASFLRGLYASILLELPKVGLTKDVGIIRQAHRYLQRLREIWESTAMVEAGLTVDHQEGGGAAEHQTEPRDIAAAQVATEYGGHGLRKFRTADAAACHLHEVSLSI